MRKVRQIIESISDILWVVKVCLTTFWFWLPVLLYSSIFLQMWLLFYVNPLTLLIPPATLYIIAVLLEKKRLKTERAILKTKPLRLTHQLFAEPEPIYNTHVEQKDKQLKMDEKKEESQK